MRTLFKLVEVRDELIGRDRDEAGRKPALRHEGGRRTLGRRAHGAGDLDVLGQVEVVKAGCACNLRNARVAEIGQRRDDRIAGVIGHVLCEGSRVRGVDGVCHKVPLAVRARDRASRVAVDVGELDLVTAGIRQQSGDERADLAGAQDQYAMHRKIT